MDAYLIIKMRHEHIRMLQVGDQHQMVVGDHVRDQVVRGHQGQTKGVDAVAEQGGRHEEANVGLDDLPVLVFGEHHGGG
jgi:hypothetical protein